MRSQIDSAEADRGFCGVEREREETSQEEEEGEEEAREETITPPNAHGDCIANEEQKRSKTRQKKEKEKEAKEMERQTKRTTLGKRRGQKKGA